MPPVDESSSIALYARGFSPNGDAVMDTMAFGLGYGDRASLESWTLAIYTQGADDKLVKNFSGNAKSIPTSISWDGLDDGGKAAKEGIYKASLSINYGKVFASVKVASDAFLLDTTAPKAGFSVSPSLFSPDGDGKDDMAILKVAPDSSKHDISAWTASVYDPAGNVFISFKADWPVESVTWNGKGISGDTVESAEDYLVRVKISDQFGNTAEAKKVLPIDILVIKTERGYQIQIASIVFKAFTADFMNVQPARAKRNLETLDLLIEKLKKFPDYRIKIVGHAVMINWDRPEAGKAEQENILIPLSGARAVAIMDALVKRGISRDRFETLGVGAADQAVLDSDLPNRWKNRRVQFFIEK